jgi:hypothetical protein
VSGLKYKAGLQHATGICFEKLSKMDEKTKDLRSISLENVTTRESTDEVENVAPSSSNPPLAGKDKAAEYLNRSGRRIEVTPEDNARILRKIDLTILPILLFVYALQSLDKTSLSYGPLKIFLCEKMPVAD